MGTSLGVELVELEALALAISSDIGVVALSGGGGSMLTANFPLAIQSWMSLISKLSSLKNALLCHWFSSSFVD